MNTMLFVNATIGFSENLCLACVTPWRGKVWRDGINFRQILEAKNIKNIVLFIFYICKIKIKLHAVNSTKESIL